MRGGEKRRKKRKKRKRRKPTIDGCWLISFVAETRSVVDCLAVYENYEGVVAEVAVLLLI